MSEKIKAVGKLAFISLISWLIPFFVHAQTLPLDETTVKNLSLLQNLEIQKALEQGISKPKSKEELKKQLEELGLSGKL